MPTGPRTYKEMLDDLVEKTMVEETPATDRDMDAWVSSWLSAIEKANRYNDLCKLLNKLDQRFAHVDPWMNVKVAQMVSSKL